MRSRSTAGRTGTRRSPGIREPVPGAALSSRPTARQWFKSSCSGGGQGECLEAARGYAGVPVRDSKTSSGPAIVFSAGGWSSFVEAVKVGRLAA
ncbi:DUF397 domain-containing protein [Streptomyces sp. NPDC005780]|uniref:DUF397 domain-containing protein n=1 Tax=Streptomyces sp. NPDC005780 TaxID=3364730 RepID=UPI0036BCE6FF